MEISLSERLCKFVEDQVREGRYSSVSEVLEAGLARLMADPPPGELDARDRAAIDESERQISRGEDLGWQEIRTRLRRQYLNE